MFRHCDERSEEAISYRDNYLGDCFVVPPRSDVTAES